MVALCIVFFSLEYSTIAHSFHETRIAVGQVVQPFVGQLSEDGALEKQPKCCCETLALKGEAAVGTQLVVVMIVAGDIYAGQ
jgi:hypothetical protein